MHRRGSHSPDVALSVLSSSPTAWIKERERNHSHSLSLSSIAFQGEQVFEGATKVDVKDGVDDRIDGRIYVAEPHDGVDDAVVCGRRTALAERKYDVHDEERKPADDERSHDDDHSACRATLLRQRYALFFLHELVHLLRYGRRLRRCLVRTPSFPPRPIFTDRLLSGRSGDRYAVGFAGRRHGMCFGVVLWLSRRRRHNAGITFALLAYSVGTGRDHCQELRLGDRRRYGDASVLAANATDARGRRGGHRRRRAKVGRRRASSGAQSGARRLKDTDVDDGHNRQRDVERPGRAVHDEATVVGELALLWVGVVERVLAAAAAVPADQRRNGNDGACRPHDDDLDEHSASGPLHRVRDRVVDGVVAVERDGAQVEDGRGAGKDVERQPRIAPDCAEGPPALDEVGHVERHHQHGDREIGARERRDEEVRNRLERRVRKHRQHDEHVAEDGGGDHRRKHQRVGDHLRCRHDARGRRRFVRQISISVRVRYDNGRHSVNHRACPGELGGL